MLIDSGVQLGIIRGTKCGMGYGATGKVLWAHMCRDLATGFEGVVELRFLLELLAHGMASGCLFKDQHSQQPKKYPRHYFAPVEDRWSRQGRPSCCRVVPNPRGTSLG
jgi:hypothetical protein